MNRIQNYLNDMLRNVEAIERFTNDGQEAFLADDRTQYAVIRAYEIIGEAAKRLPNELLAQAPDIKWQDVMGFRDFLIHRYHEIDLKIIWSAVEKLPTLRRSIETMQRKLQEEG